MEAELFDNKNRFIELCVIQNDEAGIHVVGSDDATTASAAGQVYNLP
jgi:hypothetical protein